MKISLRTVQAAEVPTGNDIYYWDTELRGFGLRVTPKGVRSYVVQYRLPGRAAQRKTLGIHGSALTPEQARQIASVMLFDAKQGNDPAQAAKKRTRDAIDLEFGRYIETFTEGYLKHEIGRAHV